MCFLAERSHPLFLKKKKKKIILQPKFMLFSLWINVCPIQLLPGVQQIIFRETITWIINVIKRIKNVLSHYAYCPIYNS